MKQITISESFSWAKQLWPILKQFENDGVNYYQVIANHADVRNRNGRVYTDSELRLAASSLSERPLNINHDPRHVLPFPENQVLAARYEDGLVEAIIQVADPKVNEQIENGEISAVSIEGMYLDGSKNNSTTEYPTSLHFQGLALLTSDDLPGDPNAKIIKEAVETVEKSLNQLRLPGVIMEHVCADLKMNNQTTQEAEWSTAQVNDLPDSAFAYIEPGGSKDSEGKTVPRDKRHLPYKGADGKADSAHVRNALARLSQTDIPDSAKAEAHGKLSSAAKELGIEVSNESAILETKIRIAKQAMEDYAHGYLSRNLYRGILHEVGMDGADSDSIVNRDVSGVGQMVDLNQGSPGASQINATNNGPQGMQRVKPDPRADSPNMRNGNPPDQSTTQDYPIGRSIPAEGSSSPMVPGNMQDNYSNAPAYRPSYQNFSGPNQQVVPKMDYPLDTNPLSQTSISNNDYNGATQKGMLAPPPNPKPAPATAFDALVTPAASLYDALKNATGNVTVKVIPCEIPSSN